MRFTRLMISAVKVEHLKDADLLAQSQDVIAIDEGQFFSDVRVELPSLESILRNGQTAER